MLNICDKFETTKFNLTWQEIIVEKKWKVISHIMLVYDLVLLHEDSEIKLIPSGPKASFYKSGDKV